MLTSLITRTLLIGALTVSMSNITLASNIPAPFGSSVSGNSAQRTIKIYPETKYINVKKGEIIKFLINKKEFIWNFDTINTQTFNFSEIAPKEIYSGNIKVYVSKNRLYSR